MLNAKVIGERLKALRKKGGLTQQQAANVVGISMRQWQEYEAGRVEPTFAVLDAFADNQKVSIFELLGDESGEHEDPWEIDIPIVDHIPAGPLNLGFGEQGVIGFVRADVRDPDAFALVVKGSSMSPEIQEDDIVIFSPRAPFVNGKIYAVVSKESEHSLKRVRYEPKSKAYSLIPSNKEFPTLYVPEEQIIRLVRALKVLRDYQ